MNPRARKPVRLLLLVVLLAVLAVLAGIVPVGVGFLKGTIAEKVQDATGLELSIEGPLKVRLGPRPAVWSGGIAVRAPGAESLLQIDSVQATASMLSLLRGRIHVRELRSDGIRLDYCAALSDFPDKPGEDTEPPLIAVDAITLSGLSIRCGPATQDDPLAVDIGSVTASAPLDSPMELSAEGRLSGLDLVLGATGGELNELLRESPVPVSAKLALADASLEATGQLRMLSGQPSADAAFEASTSSLRRLAAAFGIELPELGQLDMQGQLRLARKRIDLDSMTGNLGISDFAIDASLDFAGDRVLVTLAGTSDQLDLSPLLSGESDAPGPSSAGIDTEIDLTAALEALDILDANIDVTVGKVLGLPLDVEAIQLNAGLVGGRARLQSLNAELLGGSWSGSGELNSQTDCPDVLLLATGTNLEFATLNPMLALDPVLGGGAGTLRLETASCGNTLSQHLDTLRTDATVTGVQASLDGATLPLAVDTLTVSLQPGERGRGRLAGKLMNERIEATLAVGSLAALLGPDAWPLDIDMRGGGGQLRLNGRVRLTPNQPLVDARIRLDAPAFGTLHAWTGGAADATLPLSATTRLRFDEARIVADDTAISLGASDLRGRLAWSYAQDPDLLSITVRSNSVDIPEIAAILRPATGQTESAAQPAASDEVPGEPLLPPIDLDLEVSAIRADRLDIQHLSVSGRLRAGLIDAASVSMVVEDELHLEGRLDLDARQLPARGQLDFTAANLDIGRVLRRMELVDNLLLRADALELQINMQGTTPREFVLSTLLQADLLGFNWKIPRADRGDQTTTEAPFEVSLDQVQLSTAPGRPTTWTSLGQADGVDVELFMRAPPLNDIFGDLPELPITLVAAAGNDVAMIDTRLDLTTEDELAAKVSISGQVIARNHRDLSELESPLADYQLRSDVNLVEDQLQLTDVRMSLGSSNAEGRVAIDASGSRNRVDVSLHAPYLQTDDLLYWSRDFGQAIRDAGTDDSSMDADVEEIDTNDESTERRDVVSLANEFLTEFRKDNDLDARITVGEMHAGSGLLGGGEFQLHVDETEFSLSPVRLTLPGGGIDAEYRASIDDGRLDAVLSIRANALSYGGLLRLSDYKSEAEGLLYLDADLRANVDFQPGDIPLNVLLENARGKIGVAAWPQNFEAGILDLWSANIVLAILPKPEDGRVSRLNCMVTRFDIDDGLMKSRKTLLDTTDTVIRGRGTIDMKNEQLDLLIWPQAKRERFLSVSTPIAITGTFDDFRIGVEPGGFIGTAIRWYTSLIYVPFKWLTGERFPADGTATCFDAMDWELTPLLEEYFLQGDFSMPPAVE